MGPMLKAVARASAVWLVHRVVSDEQVSEKLRRVGWSLGLWLLAFAAAWFGILFLLGSVFLALADIEAWVRPAIFTGVLSLLAALLISFEGVRMLKKK